MLILALIIFIFISKNSENRETSTVTQEESPRTPSTQPIAQGKQVYQIIAGEKKNPQILEVEIDPLDVEIDQNQTILVKLQDDEVDSITGYDSVIVKVITDNKSVVIPLELMKAEGQGALLTLWHGIWNRDDSVDYDYRLRIEAKNTSGENSVEITFR